MRDATMMRTAAIAVLGLGLWMQASAAVLFEENFQLWVDPSDGMTKKRCDGPGGAGTYTFPAGWLLRNVDNRTPDAQTAYVNEAWEVREDFGLDTSNCAAFSTSYYAPVGAANDFMWTPAIGPLPATATELSWRARTMDGAYPDGYEVRVMTVAPTGGTGVIGNQLTNSTVLFSVAAETTGWTTHSVDLSPYAGQTVYFGFRNNSNDKFLLLVDDVVVRSIAAFDPVLTQLSQTGGTQQYARVPAPLSYTFQLEAQVGNGGTGTLTDLAVVGDVLVDGGLEQTVASTPLPSVAPGANQNVVLGGGVYDRTGTWTLEAMATSAQGDQEPSNSARELALLQVTEDELSRAEGAAAGELGIGAGNGGELGVDFTLPQAAQLEAVRAIVNNPDSLPPGTPPGPDGDGVGDFNGYTLSLVIRGWNVPANEPGGLLATATVTVPAGTPLGELPLTFDFDGLSLPAGRYLMAILEPTSPQPATMTLRTHVQRYTPGTSWITWPTNPLGGWSNAEEFGTGFARTFALTAVLRLPRNVPVALDDAWVVPETGPTTHDVSLNDTPSDQGAQTWTVSNPPATGTLQMQPDGEFDFTPAPGSGGSTVTFDYQVCDADDDCDEATVQLQVQVNTPVAVADQFDVPSDRAFAGNVAGNDILSDDGGNVWSVATPPASGLLTLQPTGAFQYTAEPATAGTDVSFTYSLCDANMDCTTATVLLQVGVNQPTAVDDAFMVFPGGMFTGSVAGNDTPSEDGGNAWTVTVPPAAGSLSMQPTGSFTYTPDAGAVGTDVEFQYRLCDVDNHCDDATVVLSVSPFGIFRDSFEGN